VDNNGGMLEDIKNQIENLTIEYVVLILVATLILFYFLLTKTQRGREVRKRFRILPRLIPLDEDYETNIEEPENLDGSNRQLKGEIIDNEHEILNQLLGQEGTEELSGFEEEDAVPAEEQDQNVPLANQNFNNMSGQIKSVSDEQEFCAKCKKPVKAEWKACPFCGEFLEIYED
tara:strand:- start:4403 stop:4924 length:522 start_codon:yes stop_codon:yes gene_type:complete